MNLEEKGGYYDSSTGTNIEY